MNMKDNQEIKDKDDNSKKINIFNPGVIVFIALLEISTHGNIFVVIKWLYVVEPARSQTTFFGGGGSLYNDHAFFMFLVFAYLMPHLYLIHIILKNPLRFSLLMVVTVISIILFLVGMMVLLFIDSSYKPMSHSDIAIHLVHGYATISLFIAVLILISFDGLSIHFWEPVRKCFNKISINYIMVLGMVFSIMTLLSGTSVHFFISNSAADNYGIGHIYPKQISDDHNSIITWMIVYTFSTIFSFTGLYYYKHEIEKHKELITWQEFHFAFDKLCDKIENKYGKY